MAYSNYPLYEPTVFEDFRVMTENAAKKFSDRVAFSYKNNPKDKDTVKVTYTEVRDYIRQMGTELIYMGLSDKHVALIGESSYKWISSYFCLMSIGSVVVPIDKDLPADEIAELIDFADCEYIIYSRTVEDKLKSILDRIPKVKTLICMSKAKIEGAVDMFDVVARGRERYSNGDNSYYNYKIDRERLAAIFFTSGSTGGRKGVMLSQKNIVTDMTQGMYLVSVSPKTMNVLPPHSAFVSTVNFVGHFAQGSEIYISSGPEYFAEELIEQQPVHLVLVPSLVQTLYRKIWQVAEMTGKANLLRNMMKVSDFLRKYNIDVRRKLFKGILDEFGGRLEFIICGGAYLSQNIIDTFESIGITVINGYGMTECAPLISCNRNMYRKKGSAGVPILGEDVRIKNPDENGEGEICIKGTNVMMGYYKDQKGTEAAFDDDGYFRTGDYGRVDEEGWLYITGRLKNAITLSNGQNMYPEEIEAEIYKILGVTECVVYAGENEFRPGNKVIVAEIYPDFEVLRKKGIRDADVYFEDEIIKINSRIPPYKAVKRIKIRREEFPKNSSMKIIRTAVDKTVD